MTGGVCAVRNTATGRLLLLSAADTAARRKRFAFAASTGTPLLPALADDWSRYGRDCFVFEVLETLMREPEQAEAQFRAELDVTRLSARGASFY